MLVAFAAIVSASVLQLAQPYLMKLAIDRYIATSDLAGMDRIALLFLGILLASFALEYVQTYVLQRTGQRIMFDLRAQIYGHLQRLDVAYYDRNPVGRLMTRVTTDVDALNDLFTSGVVSVFGDIFTLAGIMIVLLSMDWRLALVAFSVLPLIVVITQWFRRNVRDSYRKVRALVARINAFLQENITGMATVQLFGREARNLEQFRRHQRAPPRRQHRLDLLLRRLLPGHRGRRRAGDGAHHLVGRRLGARRHADARVAGGLHPVLAAVLPADQRHVGEVQPAAVGDGRLRAHLHAARHAGRRRVARVAEAGRVARATSSFDHVWFAYDGEHYVLRDVSFEVRPGERVGIVGATGAGKSTIINLLLRFYDVSRGRILVDGVDIREIDLGELRRRFSLVLQDVHLFSGTIGGNVRLGNPDIGEAQVRRALRGGARRPLRRRHAPGRGERRWPSAGRRCQRGRSSCCRSPGRWPSTRGSSCSTKRPRASTPRRSC